MTETASEKLVPTQDRIVAALVFETKSRGGIIIPATAEQNEKPIRGEVLAVGPGKRDEHGVEWPLPFRPGQKVLLRRFAGMEFEHDGRKCIVIEENHVLGVIE
jgi:chaperonin GroES